MTAETAVEDRTEQEAPEAPEAPEPQDEPDFVTDDITQILPPSDELIIAGVSCDVRPLKSREFFALMGIVIQGLGPGVADTFKDSATQEEMTAALLGAFMTALPYQFDRLLDIAVHMVIPVGSKEEKEKVQAELENPDTDVLLAVIDSVITREADNLWSLMGKARAYVARWSKTFSKTTKTQTKI